MNDSQILHVNGDLRCLWGSDVRSDQLPEEIDAYPISSIERFERAFCTNFSCCNIVFPDLHALLDHYEYSDPDSHFPPMATASTPKLTVSPFAISYSPISSPPSSPSTYSNHSSTPDTSPGPYRHVCNVPICPPTRDGEPSPSPSSSLDITDSNTSSGSQPCIYQPDIYALSDYPTYEHCYDAAKRYLASAPVPVPPVPTTDSLVYGAPKPGAPTTKRRGRPPSSASGATLEHRRKKRGKSRIDAAGVPLTRGRRNKRAYPCPTPGCSKSYLNPNGLKYHQEKGTCKIEFPVEFRVSAAKTTVPLSTPSTTALATFIAPMTTDLPKSPSPLSDVPTTPKQAPPHHLDYIPLSIASHRYEHKQSHHPQPRQLRVCDLELMTNWGTKS